MEEALSWDSAFHMLSPKKSSDLLACLGPVSHELVKALVGQRVLCKRLDD